jgi:formylglycine-generating enzyme required for sulfatase activity
VGGLHWKGDELVPNACGTPGAAPGFRLTVPSFFLDPDEATNGCYRHCVESGACRPPEPVPSAPDAPPWDDESMRLVPAQLLDPVMADAFCAWRGGRVPSLAELGRAEHGDAVAVVNEALTELWLDCAAEPKPDECATVYDHLYDSWPDPIRGLELDRGPFDHYDLAGSVVEITMTGVPNNEEEDDALCALHDAVDPRTFGSGPRAGFWSLGNLLYPPEDGTSVYADVWSSTEDGVDGGVRCAYDPE